MFKKCYLCVTMKAKRILIADSGSTKTAWLLMEEGLTDVTFRTRGINPVMQSEAEITATLMSELLPQLAAATMDKSKATDIGEIHFYGAGCTPARRHVVEGALRSCFSEARLSIESDLLGAARALCGANEGIACILGTGSNSCYYNGEQIVQNTPSLGYILGDEGGGAMLGRRFLGDLLKGLLPESVKMNFFEEYKLQMDAIIDRVYRQPMPNRFLASLAPFLVANRNVTEIHDLLVDSFRSFFARNIRNYGRPELPVHFVGSIAYHFGVELVEAAREEGFWVGRIESAPLQGIADYHRES